MNKLSVSSFFLNAWNRFRPMRLEYALFFVGLWLAYEFAWFYYMMNTKGGRPLNSQFLYSALCRGREYAVCMVLVYSLPVALTQLRKYWRPSPMQGQLIRGLAVQIGYWLLLGGNGRLGSISSLRLIGYKVALPVA